MILGTKNTASLHIPIDIIELIFLKLPSKSIIQLGSVCKTWYALTKSYRFALLRLAKTDKQCLLQFWAAFIQLVVPSELVVNLYSDPMKLPENRPVVSHYQDLDRDTWSPQLRARTFRLTGTCNGIVCLTNYADIFLVNPYIQEMKRIPTQPTQIGQDYCSLIGLGFDHLTNSFKVVTILKSWPKYQPKHRGQVYNLSTNSWTELGEIPITMYVGDFPSTFFNGVVHWCGSDVPIYRMLTFDTTTESFRQMKLPQSRMLLGVPSLLVLKQKYLAFVTHTVCGSSNQCMDIWVMKEYGVEESWIKLHSIGQLSYSIEPVSFWAEDKLLLRDCHHDKMILCDLLERVALRSVDLSDFITSRYYSLGFIVCTQSLISFRGI